MKKLFLSTILVLSILALLTGSISAQDPEYTIRLSHGDNEGNPTHIGAAKFAELVNEYTDGRVKVDIFTNNVLGGEQEVFEAVQRGNIDAEVLFTGNIHPFVREMGILQLPYLLTNTEQAWNALNTLQPHLSEKAIENADVRILGIFEKGYRVLTNSVRPVRTLEDLQGLDIRVSESSVPIKTFTAWGQPPTPMAWSEVFSALQQGVIDGQENPITTIITSNFYEVQQYVTKIRYNIWTGPLVISERVFQQFDSETQEAIKKAGREATDYMREINQEELAEAERIIIEEHGMQVDGPPEDEELWKEKARSIWPELYSEVGGEEWVKEALSILREEGVSDIPSPDDL